MKSCKYCSSSLISTVECEGCMTKDYLISIGYYKNERLEESQESVDRAYEINRCGAV